MKRIYQAADLIDAELLAERLRFAGIEVELNQQNQSAALGELPMVYPEVWIRDEDDLERASALVSKHEARSSASQAEWHCKHCGEVNPGSFEACWLCQRSP